MDRLVFGPARLDHEDRLPAMRDFVALVENDAGDIFLPQVCIVEAPSSLGSPEGRDQIAADVLASGMDHADQVASYIRSDPLESVVEGTRAAIVTTITRVSEQRNVLAVMTYSPLELAELPRRIGFLYFVHELQHACRLGVDEIAMHLHEGKADTFTMLVGAARVPLEVLDDYVGEVARLTNPLTGRLEMISHSPEKPNVYPLAYFWPLLRPLVEAIQESSKPLSLAEAMRLADEVWDRAFIPSGVDAAAYHAAKKLGLAHASYGLGSAAVTRALADEALHPVMRGVLSAYAAHAEGMREGMDVPDRLFRLAAYDEDIWMNAGILMTDVRDSLDDFRHDGVIADGLR